MRHSSKHINTTRIYLLDQMPGIWGYKDQNSVFMNMSAEYSHIIGSLHPKDMIGKTDFDIPCDAAKCAVLFIAQDKKVIETGQSIKILDIHPCANHEWKAFIFTKSPLRDKKNQIIGTIFHGIELINSNIIEVGSVLANTFTKIIIESLIA